jgi:hypothetical protein
VMYALPYLAPRTQVSLVFHKTVKYSVKS